MLTCQTCLFSIQEKWIHSNHGGITTVCIYVCCPKKTYVYHHLFKNIYFNPSEPNWLSWTSEKHFPSMTTDPLMYVSISISNQHTHHYIFQSFYIILQCIAKWSYKNKQFQKGWFICYTDLKWSQTSAYFMKNAYKDLP